MLARRHAWRLRGRAVGSVRARRAARAQPVRLAAHPHAAEAAVAQRQRARRELVRARALAAAALVPRAAFARAHAAAARVAAARVGRRRRQRRRLGGLGQIATQRSVRQARKVHAEQVVVHLELQQVRNVRLVPARSAPTGCRQGARRERARGRGGARLAAAHGCTRGWLPKPAAKRPNAVSTVRGSTSSTRRNGRASSW